VRTEETKTIAGFNGYFILQYYESVSIVRKATQIESAKF
jgi:hypothetical protein